jgi:hypothetical protein
MPPTFDDNHIRFMLVLLVGLGGMIVCTFILGFLDGDDE